jgi:hypothetical protein
MSTGKKALVIGGSLVAIGLIIYFVKKSRKWSQISKRKWMILSCLIMIEKLHLLSLGS